MSSRHDLRMFERDPSQEGVPAEHVAYVLRVWGVVYDGPSVVEVGILNGKPLLRWAHGGTCRPAKMPDEVSHIVVLIGSPIDPEVFMIPAGPVPDTVPTDFRG